MISFYFDLILHIKLWLKQHFYSKSKTKITNLIQVCSVFLNSIFCRAECIGKAIIMVQYQHVSILRNSFLQSNAEMNYFTRDVAEA